MVPQILETGAAAYHFGNAVSINGVTYDILYDVLVKQTGEPHSDWTGVPLDVEAYRHVTYEPYDLKVLEGRVE